MVRSKAPGPVFVHPTSTAFSNLCSRPKRAGWEWVFPSAVRLSRITAVESGHRRACREVQFFNLSYRPILKKVGRARVQLRVKTASVQKKPAALVFFLLSQ